MSLTALALMLLAASPQRTALVIIEEPLLKAASVAAIEQQGYKVDDQSALFAALRGNPDPGLPIAASTDLDQPLPASAPPEWEADWNKAQEICRARLGAAYKAHASFAVNLEQTCFYARAEYFLWKLAAQRKPDVVFRVGFADHHVTVLKYTPGGDGRELDKFVEPKESPITLAANFISQLEAGKGSLETYPERKGLPEMPRRVVTALEPTAPVVAQPLPNDCGNTLPAKLVLDTKSELGGALEARWMETIKAARKSAGERKCTLNTRRQYERVFGAETEVTIVELDCGDDAGFASAGAGLGFGKKGADALADGVIRSLAASMCRPPTPGPKR